MEPEIRPRTTVVEDAGELKVLLAPDRPRRIDLRQHVDRNMHKRWLRRARRGCDRLVVSVPCDPLLARYVVRASECPRVPDGSDERSGYVIPRTDAPE